MVDSGFDSTLRYAFEKLLLNRGAKHPLELLSQDTNEIDDRTSYFLEHVCTQDVMKLSLLFDGKRDIEDCRISVCARLIQV